MIQSFIRLLGSASLARQPAAAQRVTTAEPGASLHAPRRLPRTLKTIAMLVVGLALSAASAQASHFRGASLTWKRLASPANTIELTVTESWRVSPGNTYNWGDGTSFSTSSGFTTIASGSDSTGTFQIIRKVIAHTYTTEGPWTILSTGGARIGPPLVNSNQTNWRLNAVVDLRSGNQGSPVISSPIILQMVKGGVNTVPLSSGDVDGDPISFRMATSAESSITTVASAGGKTLTVSPSGVLSWDTSSTTVGQLYAVQVYAYDNHPLSPSGTGGTEVFFDFMIQIVDGTLNRPPVASGNAGPFVAAIGVPFSNVITGTDPDGGNLTVTNLGLPVGGTMTPASGTTGAQPLAATFNWTPTLAAAGSSVGVTIVFTDPGGLQASKSFSISVPANQPPVAAAGPDQTIFDIDGNDTPITVALNGSASYDPESAPLTYAWTQTSGTPTVALTGANTATPSFTAPSLKIHPNSDPIPLELIFRLDVSDGKTTRSDDVLIIVKHNNLAPVAAATGPAMALEGSLVTLDASASSDPDQDPLSFTWTQTSGTAVALGTNGTNNPLIGFAHMVPGPHSNLGELLEFTVTVSDGIATNTSAVVPVFIKNVNQAPTANAGDNDSVYDNVGQVVLAGAGQDIDGDGVTLLWTQIAGPHVALQGATSNNPTFIAPAVSPAQGSVTLTFQLVANDAFAPGDTEALNSAPSTVDVLVKHANRAPIAAAGPNKDIPEQTTATLDGSGSYDPDNDAISYAWTQTGGTPVVLDTTDPVHPTFTTPDVGPAGTTLTFSLVVTDTPSVGSGASLSSAPSAVVISVKYVNRPPVAVTGPGQITDEGGSVILNGSNSSDPDGNAFTYAWTQVSGPAAGLSDAAAAKPAVTAPMVDRFGATLVFALQVTDEFGAASNVAQTAIAVRNVNHAPVADAGETQSVPEDTDVALAGLAVDADTEEQALLTYAWQQTAGPSVTLTGGTTLSPSFRAPLVTAGGNPLAKVTLKFKLTATDPNGAAASDEMEVIVANVDHAPIANAGGIIIANEAQLVTLNGAFSSDPDGDALTYAWVQTSGPAVTLANANTATPSFTAPFVTAAGATLKFKLTVNDGFSGSSCDTATVSLLNINDPPTATNAQPSLGALWPPNHQMVLISIAGIVDPNNNATIRITKVTQDEPTNGLGDGDTAIDAIINADGTVLVRSERSGTGNGRVYRISFTVSDFEGSASGVVKVGVPHDKKDTAIDSGGVFISTQ